MLFLESDLGLDFLGLEQRSDIPQAPGAFGQGALAGVVESREGMPVHQADQSDQRAHAANAAVLRHRLGPPLAGTSQVAGALEPVFQIGLQAPVATADAPSIGELAGMQSAMHLDLL